MEVELSEGNLFTADQLADLARQLREREEATQEETAAHLGIDQAIVSKAENGEKSYRLTCIRMIELYSDFTMEHPLYRLKRKN